MGTEEKKKKPIFKKWWFWLIVALVFFYAIGDEDGSMEEKNVAEEKVEDINYVSLVKGGTFGEYKDITVGEGFENFFANTEWNYFEGEDGQKVVEFTGICEYKGEETEALIQFIVDLEKGTFEYNYLEFGGEAQTDAMWYVLLAEIFKDSKYATEATADETTEELYYHINDVVEYGGAYYSVTNVRYMRELGDEYVVVTVKIENNSDSTLCCDPSDWSLINSSGQWVSYSYLTYNTSVKEMEYCYLDSYGILEADLVYKTAHEDSSLKLVYGNGLGEKYFTIGFRTDY